jgi:hypothetical protein
MGLSMHMHLPLVTVDAFARPSSGGGHMCVCVSVRSVPTSDADRQTDYLHNTERGASGR